MAIEAVSGISASMQSQASSGASAQTSSFQGSTPTFQAEAAPRSDAADSFRETLGRLHDEMNRFQPDAAQNTAKADPVEALKADMLPSPWKTASAPPTETAGQTAAPQGGATTAPTTSSSESNNVLRKSFDHAIQVTLVSQVVGGLSQTTSTLIRQQ